MNTNLLKEIIQWHEMKAKVSVNEKKKRNHQRYVNELKAVLTEHELKQIKTPATGDSGHK